MQVAAPSPVQAISTPAAPPQPGSDDADGFSRALQQARKAAARQDQDKPGADARSAHAAPRKSGHEPAGKTGGRGAADIDHDGVATETVADPVPTDGHADRARGPKAEVPGAEMTQAADPTQAPAQPPTWLPPGLRVEPGPAATPPRDADTGSTDADGLDLADAGERARPGRAGGATAVGTRGAAADLTEVGQGRLDALAEDDATLAADAPLSGAGTGFGQALRQVTAEMAPASAGPSPLHPAAAASAPVPGTPEDAAGVPVPEREIRAPLHSPAFAPALGAQLTLLVKEGVTEARLHLNPAEMGPIAVQIQLDGHQARVEMVAEHAATRQALEQSMPSLASALRDSGLTLAGGGVFEQSTRQGQPGDAPARGQASSRNGDGGGNALDAGAEALARPAARPRGVVDLYA